MAPEPKAKPLRCDPRWIESLTDDQLELLARQRGLVPCDLDAVADLVDGDGRVKTRKRTMADSLSKRR